MTVSSAQPILVSVVVPVYDAESTLRACLNALASQDFPHEQYEVIVVDNGSTDRSWAIIQSYGPPVLALQESELRGSYAARNTGIKESRGSIIAFTDADCIPDRHWLGQLVEKFADAGIGCVAGEILGVPPMTPAERFAAAAGVLSQRSCLNNAYRPYAQTANVAYRRGVFDKIGLFEPGLVSGGDVDFCWRMQEQTAWTLWFNEEALVRHHHRAGWKELWRQFERYGRGAAALQALYPGYRPDPSVSLIEWLQRAKRLASRAVKAVIHFAMPSRIRKNIREDLNLAFYDLVSFSAFALGRRRGRTWKVTRDSRNKST